MLLGSLHCPLLYKVNIYRYISPILDLQFYSCHNNAYWPYIWAVELPNRCSFLLWHQKVAIPLWRDTNKAQAPMSHGQRQRHLHFALLSAFNNQNDSAICVCIFCSCQGTCCFLVILESLQRTTRCIGECRPETGFFYQRALSVLHFRKWILVPQMQ